LHHQLTARKKAPKFSNDSKLFHDHPNFSRYVRRAGRHGPALREQAGCLPLRRKLADASNLE
jgi:hypothetical protein